MQLSFIGCHLLANDVLIGTVFTLKDANGANFYQVDCFLPALGDWRYKLKYKNKKRAMNKLLKLASKWFDMVK